MIQTNANVTPDEIAELDAVHVKSPICLNVFRNEGIFKDYMEYLKYFITKNMHYYMNGSKKSRLKKDVKFQRFFSQFKSLYHHLIQTHSDETLEEIIELETVHSKFRKETSCNYAFAYSKAQETVYV